MTSISSAAYRVCNFVYQNTPTVASPRQILINIEKVALPAIALAGLASIPTADAGPLLGSLMVLACLPLAEAPPLFAACLVAAAAAYGVPAP